MSSYNEVMARVSVTPQMRERVLAGVTAARAEAAHAGTHDGEGPQAEVAPFTGVSDRQAGHPATARRDLPRWLPLAVAACLVVAVGIGAWQASRREVSQETPTDVLQPSGMAEFSSREELEASVGFSVPEVTDLPFEPASVTYTNAFGLARVDYEAADGSVLTLSKGIDDGSGVSGDYNDYAYSTHADISGVGVELQGSDGTYSLAEWASDGYAYALDAQPGMTEEDMLAAVESVVAQE